MRCRWPHSILSLFFWFKSGRFLSILLLSSDCGCVPEGTIDGSINCNATIRQYRCKLNVMHCNKILHFSLQIMAVCQTELSTLHQYFVENVEYYIYHCLIG